MSSYNGNDIRTITLQCVIGFSIATIGGAILYSALKKRFQRKYVKVGKVSKLLIYPVKSFSAEEVQTAKCTTSGIKVGIIHDRMWAVVDEEGCHVNQKVVPSFVLLHARLKENQMCIDGPDIEPLKLDIFDKVPNGAKVVKCKVYKSFLDAVDCGDYAAEWIQKYSGKPGLRLVQYVPEFQYRPSDMRGLCKLKGENYPILFQDGHSYLLLSEASVDELNERLEEKITYLNFRPNIVISGCQAFDEDKWKYIKIGGTATLVKTTACDRCVVTTINTEKGDKINKEPLSSLREFRLATTQKEREVFKYSPLFGRNYGMDIEGDVSVGDDVYAVFD